MALATRPKPNVSHKKRQAQHHRHNKHYLKTYRPYLPMLAIVGAGALINQAWSAGALPGVTSSALSPSLTAVEPLTRLQVLAGAPARGALDAIITISGLAFAVFVYRHWRRVHRLINQGETFVYRHAWLDVTCVFVFTVGVVLTRTSGLGR